MSDQQTTSTHEQHKQLCQKYWAVRRTTDILKHRQFLTERGYNVLNLQLRELFGVIDALVPAEVFKELIG